MKENVSTIDNYVTGDAIQFMVSTNGKTIHGRNRGLGWRTRQLRGHVNDASLQKVSGDFAGMSIEDIGRVDSSSQNSTPLDVRDSAVCCNMTDTGMVSSAPPEEDKIEVVSGDSEAKQSTPPRARHKKPSPNETKKRFSGHETG